MDFDLVDFDAQFLTLPSKFPIPNPLTPNFNNTVPLRFDPDECFFEEAKDRIEQEEVPLNEIKDELQFPVQFQQLDLQPMDNVLPYEIEPTVLIEEEVQSRSLFYSFNHVSRKDTFNLPFTLPPLNEEVHNQDILTRKLKFPTFHLDINSTRVYEPREVQEKELAPTETKRLDQMERNKKIPKIELDPKPLCWENFFKNPQLEYLATTQLKHIATEYKRKYLLNGQVPIGLDNQLYHQLQPKLLQTIYTSLTTKFILYPFQLIDDWEISLNSHFIFKYKNSGIVQMLFNLLNPIQQLYTLRTKLELNNPTQVQLDTDVQKFYQKLELWLAKFNQAFKQVFDLCTLQFHSSLLFFLSRGKLYLTKVDPVYQKTVQVQHLDTYQELDWYELDF